MLFKEVSIFNTHLINNISCFISNLFDLKIKILNLDWIQESYSLDFENIIWEKFKFLEYLLNMSPSFHEHLVFNQGHELILFCSWKKYMFSFYLGLFQFSILVISELSLWCFKHSDIFCDKHFTAFLKCKMSKDKCTPLFALKYGTFIVRW